MADSLRGGLTYDNIVTNKFFERSGCNGTKVSYWFSLDKNEQQNTGLQVPLIPDAKSPSTLHLLPKKASLKTLCRKLLINHGLHKAL